MPPLGHDAGGYEDGLSGDRNPGALQQHAEENDQVPVVADQGEDMVYGLQGLPILLLTRQTVRVKGAGCPYSPSCRQRVFSETDRFYSPIPNKAGSRNGDFAPQCP